MLNAAQVSIFERWSHPEVILVATGLSDLERLMPFAIDQARQTGARLLLLHVLGTGSAISVDPTGIPSFDPASAMEFAGRALEPSCAEVRRQGISCDILLREGPVPQQIAAVVRQFRADRLLIGTRNRSKLGKLLLGSVAE